MRGAGRLGWGNETVYGYFTLEGDTARIRLSIDEADRLGVVEGARVRLALPGRAAVEGWVTAVRREPPFVWAELRCLATRLLGQAG